MSGRDGPEPREKTCATCGRPFEWRKKWERCWSSVRYCSDRCRRRRGAGGANDLDTRLERAILDLLAERASTSTICPSEAARRVAPDRWRELMNRTRDAGRRLAARGEIDVLQSGARVDPATVRGPCRYRRARTS